MLESYVTQVSVIEKEQSADWQLIGEKHWQTYYIDNWDNIDICRVE